MPVDILLPGAADAFTIATDGDPAFVAAEIRKMASQGDGYAVLSLDDGALLILNPASTWFRLRSAAAHFARSAPREHSTSGHRDDEL